MVQIRLGYWKPRKPVENAKSGKFVGFIKFLNEPGSSFCNNDTNSNPVTRSQFNLAQFGWFHQSNCKTDIETFRMCSLVHEIAGLINK